MMFSKGPASRLRRPLVEAARLLSGGRMQTESISCRSSIERFLDNYDTFLFDCDGVVWKNDHVTPIPGIPEAIEKLHQIGKTVIYVTNNSMVSRASLQKKFNQYGFDSSLTHIYGPGYCAALYLKDVLGIGGRTYLVGGTAMKWELDQLGVANCGVGPDTDIPSSNVHHLLDHTFHDDIQAVLVGFDEHFSFNKIFKAASYISYPECHFLATNTVEQGLFIGEGRKDGPRRLPLTGVKVNAIAMAANRAPFVIGKPYRTMFDCVLQTHPDIDPSRTVFVGDNLKADMAFAKTIGVDSTLVLSGVHGYNDVKENSHLAPTYILGSLADIT